MPDELATPPTQPSPRRRRRVPRPRIPCPACLTSALCMALVVGLVAVFISDGDGLTAEEIGVISAIVAAQCGIILRAKNPRRRRRQPDDEEPRP